MQWERLALGPWDQGVWGVPQVENLSVRPHGRTGTWARASMAEVGWGKMGGRDNEEFYKRELP